MRPAGASARLTAATLLDAAERSGTLWQLEQAARIAALRSFRNAPATALLFLNCSPSIACDPRTADVLTREVTSVARVPPRRVVLEITEHGNPVPLDTLAARTRPLRRRGFRLALDDVGAGTSTLGRLARLRPDWIKLDRCLTHRLETDAVQQNLVRSLDRFARDVDARLSVEGVESPAQLAAVWSVGVRYAQGFLFGQPGHDLHHGAREAIARLARLALSSTSARWRTNGAGLGHVIVLAPHRTADDARRRLFARSDAIGLVVNIGRNRFHWVPRADALRIALRSPDRPLDAFASRAVAIHCRALHSGLLARRILDTGQIGLFDPLIIHDGRRVLGVTRAIDQIARAQRPASIPVIRRTA